MDFKQSETKKNLMRAFAGESQARNRYIFAAAQAKEQKMQVVEFVFRFTAKQEVLDEAFRNGLIVERVGRGNAVIKVMPAAIPWIFMNPFRSFCVRQSITNMKNLTRCIRRLGIRRWRRAFRRWQHPFIRLQALKKHMETVSDSLQIYWRKINYSSILWNVNGCA